MLWRLLLLVANDRVLHPGLYVVDPSQTTHGTGLYVLPCLVHQGFRRQVRHGSFGRRMFCRLNRVVFPKPDGFLGDPRFLVSLKMLPRFLFDLLAARFDPAEFGHRIDIAIRLGERIRVVLPKALAHPTLEPCGISSDHGHLQNA